MYAHRTNPTTSTAVAGPPGSEVYAAFRLLQARMAINSQMAAACFTDAERLRANDSAYQCADLARLGLWLANVTRVAAERTANRNKVAEATAVAGGATAARAAAAPRLRTADLAGEISYARNEAAFSAETGLSYAELATL
jgi:hypothetical protein